MNNPYAQLDTLSELLLIGTVSDESFDADGRIKRSIYAELTPKA